MKRLALLLFVPLLLACVTRDHDGEEIGFAETPDAVRQAVLEHTTADQVTEVEKETENGKTVYDVEYTKDGKTWCLEIDESGKVLEHELEDDDDDDDDEHDDDHDDDEGHDDDED